MKIALLYKPSNIKAYSFFIAILLYVGFPNVSKASFFSDLPGIIFGTGVASGEIINQDNNGVIKNSQTVALLESSVNPDMKNIKDPASVVIVDDEALSLDSLQGTETDTYSYISSTDKITTYTVKSGDTIGEIATKFNISKNTIIYANTTIKNNVLKVGQTLIILPVDGISYTVKKGDTIASIAKAYKADSNDISEYNNISGDKGLIAGEDIIVPGGIMAQKTVVAPTTTVKEKPVTQPVAPKKDDKNDTVVPRVNTVPSIAKGTGITGGYIWPFPSGTGRVSQKLHDDNAYDFAAPKGTPIYAIQDGTVLIADGNGYNGGYGLYVVVNFDNGGQAIFGHMSKVVAVAGQTVQKGDIIGYVGSTGRSTGNHVHIGIRGGVSNPYKNLALNSNGS